MVARLVIDVLRRTRWLYLIACFFLVPCWFLFAFVSRTKPLPIGIMAVSLISAAVLGPMFGSATMGLRELRHLPITTRDVWRATWVVATVVPAGLLFVSKTISVLLLAASQDRATVSAELILLSAVYDFSWAGAFLPLLPLFGYAANAASQRGTLVTSLAAGGMLFAVMACLGLPILVNDVLPTRVSDFTPATTAVLMVCLAITFGGLAWTPHRGVLAGERMQPRGAGALSGRATRQRLPDRLSGIARVAVPQLLATLVLAVGACLALASYGAASGWGAWWFVPQTKDMFDSADLGGRELTFFVLMPCAIVTMQGVWTPWARLLKVMPLSVKQINALLLLTPVATWAVLWLVAGSVYSLAYGMPSTLRIDLAIGLAGIAALAHAVFLRFQGGTAFFWVIGVIGGLMPQLLKVGLSNQAVAHLVFAILGAIAFLAASLVNHHTLTRSTSSSRAYQRPASPFGVPKTAGLR